MYWFGGDYNPSPAEMEEDLALMRQAGINLATIGVFGWSALQPSATTWEFGWLDDLLDKLHAAGIGVALATPTASPPPWFTLAHPDAMPQTREGVRLVHGSRDTYCVNAPAYREACLVVASQLAARYGSHPALRLWHVHNEYGTWCFCDHCAVAFRQWLRLRHGSLEALNQAWTTDFWSQRYGRWEEILPPRATQYLRNPAHDMDYRRFLSDSMLAAYREQRDAIKAVSGAPVTTNFVLGDWVPVDHARWAAEVDIVAIDHYPSTLDAALAEAAFAGDMARGWAGGRPWLLMEHAPTDLMEPLALSYIARGSQGALYFQWRANRGGAEQWHPAIHGRFFERAVALGGRLRDLPHELPQSDDLPRAEVAIWYDEQCSWALQATSHLPATLNYQATVQQCHAALERRGYAVDVTPPALFTEGASATPYRLVVVPAAYLVTQAAHDALQAFANGGGHVLFVGPCGVVDENLRIRDFSPDWELSTMEDQLLAACDTAGVKPVVAGLPAGTRARRARGALWLFHPDGSVEVTT